MTRINSHKQQGFTLTEIIVTLAIFGIVMVAIIGAVSTTQSAQQNERYLDLANTTAKQIIEETRNGQYASLANTSYNRTANVPASLPDGHATMVVSQSADMPDTKRIEVTVGYKIGSYDRAVTQTAYITESGI
ncbi:MAG: type II secretion system protein [Candidatus Saccharimonadales bacterium]